MSKVINNRLYPLLPSLIKNDQNGFIKHRNIGDNIWLMCDSIDYTNYRNAPGAVLSIDLHKAFDFLNWFFIFAMLKSYGFKNFLIQLIEMMYKNLNDNFLSFFFFAVSRGGTQGDPLSPTVFILCIEYLTLLLRQSQVCKGLTIKKHCFKFSLLADDTVIYLNGNPSQFNFVFTILNDFGRHTCCSVNFNKSVAFCSGSSKENTTEPYSSQGLSWLTNAYRYFGVTFPIDECANDRLFNLNFSSVFHKVKTN